MESSPDLEPRLARVGAGSGSGTGSTDRVDDLEALFGAAAAGDFLLPLGILFSVYLTSPI